MSRPDFPMGMFFHHHVTAMPLQQSRKRCPSDRHTGSLLGWLTRCTAPSDTQKYWKTVMAFVPVHFHKTVHDIGSITGGLVRSRAPSIVAPDPAIVFNDDRLGGLFIAGIRIHSVCQNRNVRKLQPRRRSAEPKHLTFLLDSR